jgi:D-aspartate ligase
MKFRSRLKSVPVLIFNANAPIALTILRSLGSKNIPVDALFGRPSFQENYRSIVRASRYIRRRFYFSEEAYDENCLAALTAIAAGYDQKAVLIPLNDRDMLFLSMHREALSRHYHFHLSPHEVVVVLLDKIRFAGLAEKQTLPIPETHVPESADEVAGIAEHLPYPCILKPDWRQTRWDEIFQSQKGVVCRDADDLTAQYRKLAAMGLLCLIQEIIPGPDDRIYCAFGILDAQSRPLVLHVCRKLRQSPPMFGNTALAESVCHPAVKSLFISICGQLELTGYISIEFKLDDRDGRFKILEITPARPNRQLGIAVAAGVDVPFIWYRWLLHESFQIPDTYQTGLRWMSEIMELRSLPAYLRRHHMGIRSVISSYRRVRRFEILSSGDIGPFLMFLAHPLTRLLSRATPSKSTSYS